MSPRLKLTLTFVTLALCQAQTLKEDWSSPTLTGSNLKILDIVGGERDTYATFTREMMEVTWRPGDPVYIFVILPKNNPHPPAIVYLYGFPSDTERFLNDEYCQFLTKDGVAAIGFVSALTGHRYHSRPMKEWFVSELREALSSSAHDVQMVLNYVAGRGDVDMHHIGMFGEGSGAAIGILAAAVDSRIKVLDLADPWGDWPAWMAKSSLIPEEERPNYLKPEFLRGVADLDPVKWLPRLKVPVRLQYLSEPGVTPAPCRERILAAAPPQAKVVAHEEAVAQYKVAKLKFFDWLKDQVRADGRAVSAANARKGKID